MKKTKKQSIVYKHDFTYIFKLGEQLPLLTFFDYLNSEIFFKMYTQFFTPELETPQSTWPYYPCPFVVCHSVTVSSWTNKNTQESVQRTGCLMQFRLLGSQCQDSCKIVQPESKKLQRHAHALERLKFGWMFDLPFL